MYKALANLWAADVGLFWQGFCLVVIQFGIGMSVLDVLSTGRSCWGLPDRYGNAAICIGFLRSVVEEEAAE
jgi:hypothetical protein